jgi:hypothetical protein
MKKPVASIFREKEYEVGGSSFLQNFHTLLTNCTAPYTRRPQSPTYYSPNFIANLICGVHYINFAWGVAMSN